MENLENLQNNLTEDAPANSTGKVAGADSGSAGKFAGSHIFRVTPMIYNQCLKG